MIEIYKNGFMKLFYATYYSFKIIFATILMLLFNIVAILLIPFWCIKKVINFLNYISEIISEYIYHTFVL